MMIAPKKLKHTLQRTAGYLPVLILMLFLNGSPALAHKVSIFAWVEGDTVHTQSKFMGGKRPAQALIEVFDEAGNLLLEGETDAQGFFSFQAPRKTGMQIVLAAGMGHRAVWKLSRADFQENAVEPDTRQEFDVVAPKNTPKPELKLATTGQAPENGLSAAEVSALVDASLDRKLKPLINRITALNENRVSLSDILGGIGYIVGLVGLAAYMRYHRKRSDVDK